MHQCSYTVGIDCGDRSLGVSAIEIDTQGNPVRILSIQSLIHDGGVGPDGGKSQTSRKAKTGNHRRVRNRLDHRRDRLRRVDQLLTSLGWVANHAQYQGQPEYQWHVRADLATTYIPDKTQRRNALGIAIEHIARHRGQRSTWISVNTLINQAAAPSEAFTKNLKRINNPKNGWDVIEPLSDPTPAQLACTIDLKPNQRIRPPGEENKKKTKMECVFEQSLQQQDTCRELIKILKTQQINEETATQILHTVFQARSPRSAARELAGYDPLPGQQHLRRAPQATLEFQQHRILTTVANLRIRYPQNRPLTLAEQHDLYDFLWARTPQDKVTWRDVAAELGVNKSDLDPDRLGTLKPPTNNTRSSIETCSIQPLKTFWQNATHDEQAAMIVAWSTDDPLEDLPGGEQALELLDSLSETELAQLETLHLPPGRSAYSLDTLRRINAQMITTGQDLYTARQKLFNIPNDWEPPTPPIGEPTGQPAVDRVFTLAAHWLHALEQTYGPPQRVTIEHVREGFSSPSKVTEHNQRIKKNTTANNLIKESIGQLLGKTADKVTKEELQKHKIIQRQNSQCLYCGETITYDTTQLDHIRPRSGPGSSNNSSNLAATCSACNQAKGKQLYLDWAQTSSRTNPQETLARANMLLAEPDTDADNPKTPTAVKRLREHVIYNLTSTHEDDAIDERSIAAVAYMAKELASRIKGHYQRQNAVTLVQVFRGEIVHGARGASGLQGRINLIGGKSKTRLDRRHHAIDAAVVSFLRPSVAKTIAQRSSLRAAHKLTGTEPGWKHHTGDTHADRHLYEQWRALMNQLTDLLNTHLDHDQIPVVHPKRLRLENGTIHEEGLSKLGYRVLGRAIPADIIDAAETPQLWSALTSQPDYHPTRGLPENPTRTICVNNRTLGPTDTINYFATRAENTPKGTKPTKTYKYAAVKVRGGYAGLKTPHHVRLFQVRDKKGATTIHMMRVYRTDLTKHATMDLFTAPITPNRISHRTAPKTLRKAITEQRAHQIGHLVRGDILTLPHTVLTGPSRIAAEYFNLHHWVITGFESEALINLKPAYLAAEGLENIDPQPPQEILAAITETFKRGYRTNPNTIINNPQTKLRSHTTTGKTTEKPLLQPAQQPSRHPKKSTK